MRRPYLMCMVLWNLLMAVLTCSSYSKAWSELGHVSGKEEVRVLNDLASSGDSDFSSTTPRGMSGGGRMLARGLEDSEGVRLERRAGGDKGKAPADTSNRKKGGGAGGRGPPPPIPGKSRLPESKATSSGSGSEPSEHGSPRSPPASPLYGKSVDLPKRISKSAFREAADKVKIPSGSASGSKRRESGYVTDTDTRFRNPLRMSPDHEVPPQPFPPRRPSPPRDLRGKRPRSPQIIAMIWPHRGGRL